MACWPVVCVYCSNQLFNRRICCPEIAKEAFEVRTCLKASVTGQRSVMSFPQII